MVSRTMRAWWGALICVQLEEKLTGDHTNVLCANAVAAGPLDGRATPAVLPPGEPLLLGELAWVVMRVRSTYQKSSSYVFRVRLGKPTGLIDALRS